MRSRKSQNKENPKMYFCKLCAFITESPEELDMHYKMSHELSDESEVFFETRVKKLEDGTILIKIPEIGTCVKYPDGRFEC